MKTTFDEARRIITALENMLFKGAVIITPKGYFAAKEIEDTSPQQEEILEDEDTTIVQRFTPIEKVEWARSPEWTEKVIALLKVLKLNYAEDLEEQSIQNLKDAKISESYITMIREGLGTLGKHLRGSSIKKRSIKK